MQSPAPYAGPLLSIQLLGVLRVKRIRNAAARPLHLPHGPVSHLLGYLALNAPTPVPRSRLAGLLNPDLPEANARRALTDALYRLRRELGDAAECVRAGAEAVDLDAEHVQIDVHEFRRAIASPQPEDWKQALDLYAGDLLEDQDAEWLLGPRAVLREQFLSAHERLYTARMQASEWAEALACAHRWALADPLCEQAHRAAMQLYARLGRPAAALEQYERLVRLLADELDIEPLPETHQLAEAIRHEYEMVLEKPEARARFVGRRRERGELLRAAEQAQSGQGGMVLVEGEPGIGKTRLLEAFAESAAWRGLTVVWGRARELAAASPYAPLGEALAAALAGPKADQVRLQLKPEVAQAAAFLAPRLQPDPPVQVTSPPDLPTAAVQVLRAIGLVTPHVFIFDDVQWTDSGFWQVLQNLAPHLATERLLVVLCYRGEELRANASLWPRLCELERDLLLPKVLLQGLTLSECSELARASQSTVADNAVQRLFQRTGGNPLFFSEALEQDEQTSASFRTLLERRWASLNPSARTALQAGAVLGREFTHGTWQAVAEANLLEEIPLLLATRFVDETEHGYVFQHDLTREFVYGTASHELLRELHGRAALALARENTGPDVLAWHFEQAHAWDQAVRYYREAGQRAERAFAYEAALAHFTHALELHPRVADMNSVRLALLRDRQRVLDTLKRIPEWRSAVAALERAARSQKDYVALLEALQARVFLSALAADWQGFRRVASEAIALAKRTSNPAAEAAIRNELGFQLCDALGELVPAWRELESAARLAEAHGSTDLIVHVLENLASLERLEGHCSAALAINERILALVESRPHLRVNQIAAVKLQGMLEAELARWESAYALVSKAVDLAIELGDQTCLGSTVFDLGIICTRIGQHAKARYWIDRYIREYAELGGAPDSVYGRWIRALSGNACVLAGDLPQAERVFAELESWIATGTEGRPLLMALGGIGRLALARQRPHDALAPLARAAQLCESAGGGEIAPLLLHALAAQQCGDSKAARHSMSEAEAALEASDVIQHNVLLSYVRFELTGRIEDLEAARAEIQRQAALFTDLQLRSDFVSQVQLHRDIEERWQTLHAGPPPLLVRLARSTAPLGKRLADSDYVQVRWTVDAGPADAALGEQQGKVALRQHRLRRLLAQASAQGAAPTDEDLAQALGVDRRTILRDMAALRAVGKTPQTRRRR